MNNHGDLDALVVYDEYLYGYIRDIEREDSKGVPYFHVSFECIDQQWFGQLHDDLRDMPRWNTAGQDSKFCIVDLTVSANVLQDMITTVDGDAPYFFPGNWVEMVVNRNDDPRDNRPLAAAVRGTRRWTPRFGRGPHPVRSASQSRGGVLDCLFVRLGQCVRPPEHRRRRDGVREPRVGR
ncbi:MULTISPECIES: hypothetical protein [Myxococcus]|uniref:hypothetical protein n=1 Tax=Myxococcus TaxID=32 RepID=UPI001144DA0C|nr:MULTISPECIES: hypothetical protein [Myxococcus]NOK03843.1 hypothetical protein [Myxococcus xanthus]